MDSTIEFSSHVNQGWIHLWKNPEKDTFNVGITNDISEVTKLGHLIIFVHKVFDTDYCLYLLSNEKASIDKERLGISGTIQKIFDICKLDSKKHFELNLLAKSVSNFSFIPNQSTVLFEQEPVNVDSYLNLESTLLSDESLEEEISPLEEDKSEKQKEELVSKKRKHTKEYLTDCFTEFLEAWKSGELAKRNDIAKRIPESSRSYKTYGGFISRTNFISLFRYWARNKGFDTIRDDRCRNIINQYFKIHHPNKKFSFEKKVGRSIVYGYSFESVFETK